MCNLSKEKKLLSTLYDDGPETGGVTTKYDKKVLICVLQSSLLTLYCNIATDLFNILRVYVYTPAHVVKYSTLGEKCICNIVL